MCRLDTVATEFFNIYITYIIHFPQTFDMKIVLNVSRGSSETVYANADELHISIFEANYRRRCCCCWWHWLGEMCPFSYFWKTLYAYIEHWTVCTKLPIGFVPMPNVKYFHNVHSNTPIKCLSVCLSMCLCGCVCIAFAYVHCTGHAIFWLP